MAHDNRGRNGLHRGIVLTMSAEPLDLPAGPLKLLLRLRQMAGKSRCLDTRTSSLATILGVTTNTVRNWRRVLVDEGLIHWLTRSCNRMAGWVRILIRDAVEPPSRQGKLAEQRRIDALPSPLPWQPPKPVLVPSGGRPWWQPPLRRAIEALARKAAFSAPCPGGAKAASPIKTREEKTAQEVEALARKWGLA